MRRSGFDTLRMMIAVTLAVTIACAAPAVAALAAAAPPKPAVSPVLTARPGAAADSLAPGITQVANDGLVYRPATLGPGQHPLIVLLHGAGQGADELIPAFRTEADKRGLILLAPKSAEPTWDLITSAARFHGRAPKNGELPEFGLDVARIDAALAALFQTASIDPNHIILAGFSDGAGYALSLGLANPKLFHGVLAFAPGMMIAPGQVSLAQRIFIAHGRADRVIPIRVSRDNLAPALTAAGMKMQYRDFNGDHKINREALDEGLTFVLQDTP